MSHSNRSVCVFCGASDGRNPDLRGAAEQVGGMLARNHWRLVYGAGDVGLMGAVARGAGQRGGSRFGVIPQHLLEREAARRDLSTLVVTETMHERKKVMFTNSDAVVVLPGGAGTLDEFFEVLTWRQLGLHRKPILLLNIAGCWDPLLALLDSVIANGFARPSLREFVTVCDSVTALEAALQTEFE